MADIAASDVTYTANNDRYGKSVLAGSGMRKNDVTVAFGNGALTYPAGGVPLTKAKLGCPNFLQSVEIFDASSANGFLYKYDRTNEKIRIYQGDNDNVADAALIELIGGSAAPAAVSLKVNATGF
jgi:hypothetical protein